MPLAAMVLPEVNHRLSRAHLAQYEHARQSVRTNTTMRGLVESEGLLHSLRADQQTFALNYLDTIDGVSTAFLTQLRLAFGQNLAIEVLWQDSAGGPMSAISAPPAEGKVQVTLAVPNDPGFPS